MRYTTVIFDLDGTVLNNEVNYARAFTDVLIKNGVTRDKFDEFHPQEIGVGLEANWRRFKEKYNLAPEIGVLANETQNAYLSRLGEVDVKPGFIELVEALRNEDISIGLATSNDWWVVEDELADLELEKYFDAIVTIEEVLSPKPAPDLFLEAARKLGAEYSQCVVIEDSVVGIKAAKEALMVGVGLATDFVAEEDFIGADWVVNSLEDITPRLIDALFQD